MAERKLGQLILAGLTLIALLIVGIDVWHLIGSVRAAPPTIDRSWNSYALVVGPFHSIAYVAAVILLPLALVKRIPQARRALAGTFAIFMLLGVLWWSLAAKMPSSTSDTEIAFARLCWFLLVPALYLAGLFSRPTTRYLEEPLRPNRHSNRRVHEE